MPKSKQKKTQDSTTKTTTLDSKVCGIDYSITSPAFTIYDGSTFNTFYLVARDRDLVLGRETSETLNPKLYPKYSTDMERYSRLASWVCDELMWQHRPYCAIENYAYAATGRVFNIGENTGILKYKLHQNRLMYETVTPQIVKKFATGKGNAKKVDMAEAFTKETGLDLTGIKQWSDISDSYWISRWLYYKSNEDTSIIHDS